MKKLYEIYKKFPIIATDSRALLPHSIFFALKGENFNGNKFAEKALNVCEYAIIDEKEYAINNRTILVDNVLETLQKLANFHRKQFSIPIIAITGTNGKTTTKELVSTVLSEKYKVHYTKGNFNNHLGVPLTLLSMPLDTEMAVIEMGANHPGEIATLCKIAEPTHGLITNIGKAHIEGFGSFEGVIKTKNELYDFLNINGGEIFYNSDNKILTDLTKTKIAFSYGRESANILGAEISSDPYLAIKWTNKPPEGIPPMWAGKEKHIQSQLIGNYNFENILAAASVGYFFNVEKKQIKNAIESYAPENNRSQFVKTKKNSLILDAYNANPSSMTAALDNFAQMEAEKKMLILGDMLELGDISEKEHENIILKVQEMNLKNVLFVGTVFSKVCKEKTFNLRYFTNSDECADCLKKNKPENQTILIKGSRGIKLETVVPFL